jgi:Xaa-Pro dipeptidase
MAVSYRNDTDREQSFRQESNFYYLSGCVVPSAFLLISYHSGTVNTPAIEMFIPKADPLDIMWSIPPPSLDEAAKTHDVTRIHHTTALSSAITQLMKDFPDALFHTLPRNSPLFPTLPEEYPQLILTGGDSPGTGPAVTDAYLLLAIHRARLIKSEFEIAEMKRANEISSRAHEVVMRVLGNAVRGRIVRGMGAGVDRPLLPGEWLIQKEAEAEAIFVASCRREGFVQSFLDIGFVAQHALAARSTRRTSPSWLRLPGRLPFTTVATTVILRGAQSPHTITRMGVSLRLDQGMVFFPRCCSLMLDASGIAMHPIVSIFPLFRIIEY